MRPQGPRDGLLSSATPVPKILMDPLISHLQQHQDGKWSDGAVLYFSLVADGGLPAGHLRDFLRLSPWVSAAAQRQAAQLRSSLLQRRGRHHPSSSPGFISRVFKDLRRERTRIQLLVNLIGSDTPMRTPLQARQSDIAILGAGRRAGTIRSRVRNVRHFLAWLAVNHGITYPTDQTHLTEFLQDRLSEPCNRGSLKITHESFVFLVGRRISASSHEFATLHQYLSRTPIESATWQGHKTGSTDVYGDAERLGAHDHEQHLSH